MLLGIRAICSLWEAGKNQESRDMKEINEPSDDAHILSIINKMNGQVKVTEVRGHLTLGAINSVKCSKKLQWMLSL